MSFFRGVGEIEKKRQERLLAEERWTESWNTSISKIKALY